ncbi:MAG TPA: NAD(P)H-hydrate dehydratase [Usitatibacter sp.]|nr:NAD(P)H-hydrate dehydratase [Usitatibacter sp.]
MNAVPVLTTAELREVEERAKGESLMERAGRAVAEAARRLATDTGAPILVVAGPGNNGGDAWVAAALLAESFHRVIVFDVAGKAPKAPEARAARDRFSTRGGSVVREWPQAPRPALVVDGLLGIGLERDVEAPLSNVIERMNASGVPVLSIDIPSGLDGDTGAVRGTAVHATHTITFIAHKVGLHTGDGLDHRGLLELDDLGTASLQGKARGMLLTPEAVSGWIGPRAHNSHKGDFGTLAVIGGNRGMVGAALLAARAALLCGAGKVRTGLLSPDAPAVDLLHPEVMLGTVDDALKADVIVAGPGAGQSPSATSVSMFERTVLPALINSSKPMVLDADALNAIAFNSGLEDDLASRKKGSTILTPHPGEAARLLHKDNAAVNGDRLAAALALAKRFNAQVVLKGAGSICASPGGMWSINTTGNPGLASGGTGDVLAGIVGAMLAQGLDPAKALRYAVCLHGAAADSCVARGLGPAGLAASEVALEARRVMNDWTRGAQ